MVPFERYFSKLSENQKIVEIGSTEFKLHNKMYTHFVHCFLPMATSLPHFPHFHSYLSPLLESVYKCRVRELYIGSEMSNLSL